MRIVTPSADTLSQLSDPELIALWRERQCLLSRNTLVERHLPEMQRILAAIVRSQSKHVRDVADLQQDLFFSLLEAIERHRRSASQLRSFAGCIAFRNVKKAQRMEARRAQRFELSVRAQRVLDGTTMDGICLSNRRSLDGFGVADPLQVAQENEQQERFERLVAEYPWKDRVIIDGFRQNSSPGDVGKRLHVCARTVMRRFGRLIGQLAVSLDAPQLKSLHWGKHDGKRWTQTHGQTNGNGATTLKGPGTMISDFPSPPALGNSYVSTVFDRSRFD